MKITNEILICKIAEDVEAGLITTESVLDVLLEKYDASQLAIILDILDRNGYQTVIDKFIIEKHNRLLKLHENMDLLERCWSL